LLHDITARKQAESVIQQYAHELETRNTELEARNAELDAFAHTGRTRSQESIECVNWLQHLAGTTLSPFVAGKNPGTYPAHHADWHKITTIINELLLLSSVRKMDQVECQPLAMQAIVAEALERFVAQIGETHAQVHVASDWPTAVGYAPWVEEVWVNYLSNALKYSGRPDEHIPPMWNWLFVPEFRDARNSKLQNFKPKTRKSCSGCATTAPVECRSPEQTLRRVHPVGTNAGQRPWPRTVYRAPHRGKTWRAPSASKASRDRVARSGSRCPPLLDASNTAR
jgi:hypothetical protein